MEQIILGLLLLRERSMYELKKVIEQRVALFYSASFGSISVALERLEERGLIEGRALVERGRNKRLYAITRAGAAAFEEWLRAPIPAERVREPALARLFFLGNLPPAERATVIAAHLATVEELAAGLELLAQEAEQLEVPEELREQARFQLLTLQYGRDYYAFSAGWFRQLLTDLHSEGDTRDGGS